MIINQNDLKEIYGKGVKLVGNDERFYAMPGANCYAISTYCRVFQKTKKGWFKKLRPLGYDYFIKFDDAEGKQQISINKLAALVFFPSFKGAYLETPPGSYGIQRWKIENMHLLLDKEMIIENWLAKMEQRKPSYDIEHQHHNFINRIETPNINNLLKSKYRNMKSRATNSTTKKLNPAYKNTTICKKWENNPDSFKQWFLVNQYFYPAKLEIDKDLLNFGQTNEYVPENCCLLPRYINDVFTKGKSELAYTITKLRLKNGSVKYQIPGNAFGGGEPNAIFDNYLDALKHGRERKAKYIRKIIDEERKRGYIPDFILNRMMEWATLIELGDLTVLEPTIETILKEAS